jgi:hypothetical protein
MLRLGQAGPPRLTHQLPSLQLWLRRPWVRAPLLAPPSPLQQSQQSHLVALAAPLTPRRGTISKRPLTRLRTPTSTRRPSRYLHQRLQLRLQLLTGLAPLLPLLRQLLLSLLQLLQMLQLLRQLLPHPRQHRLPLLQPRSRPPSPLPPRPPPHPRPRRRPRLR